MITFNRQKESGNIFQILCEVRKVMQKERRITEYDNMWEDVQKASSYEEALNVIGQHVHLRDEATGKEY